jgi:hypothetical protein
LSAQHVEAVSRMKCLDSRACCWIRDEMCYVGD